MGVDIIRAFNDMAREKKAKDLLCMPLDDNMPKKIDDIVMPFVSGWDNRDVAEYIGEDNISLGITYNKKIVTFLSNVDGNSQTRLIQSHLQRLTESYNENIMKSLIKRATAYDIKRNNIYEINMILSNGKNNGKEMKAYETWIYNKNKFYGTFKGVGLKLMAIMEDGKQVNGDAVALQMIVYLRGGLGGSYNGMLNIIAMGERNINRIMGNNLSNYIKENVEKNISHILDADCAYCHNSGSNRGVAVYENVRCWK